MIRAAWRRAGPWLTPALVAAEVGLVWSGLLSLPAAVVVGLVVEALLWLTAVSRTVSAVRRFRASRTTGVDVWAALEDALAQLVPRPAARFLLLEPRMWTCLVRWVSRQHEGRRAGAYGYHRGVTVAFWVLFAYTCLELLVVEGVLLLAVPDRIWHRVALGVHSYALAWLLGLAASYVTRPHLVDRDALRLRDGVFGELVVPCPTITSARVARRPVDGFGGPTGVKVDAATRTATLGLGVETTVTLRLDPDGEPPRRNGVDVVLRELHLTVDDPHGFVAAVTARLAEARAAAEAHTAPARATTARTAETSPAP